MDKTLVSMFLRQVERSARRVALRSKRSGRWVGTTWQEWHDRSLAAAAWLVDAGVRPGDRVAIVAGTREENVVWDMGAMIAGAATVPVYPTLPADALAYVLRDSASRVVVAEDDVQIAKVPGSFRAVRIDGAGDARAPSAAGCIEAGARALEGPTGEEVRRRAAAVRPDGVATVVYTSGTTGEPKGVVLGHDNFAFEIDALRGTLPFGPADEQVLFLPLAHIFGRVLVMAALEVGYATAFARGMGTVLDDVAEIDPTFLGAVPLFFEKIQAETVHRGRSGGRFEHAVFRWAVGTGLRAARRAAAGGRPGRVLGIQKHYADRLVLRAVRKRFGRRLRFALSGGAPLGREVAEWFHACGVLVLEGYGLTETTSATHVNRPGAYRFGTVGQPVPGVEVRVAPDGEVSVRGRNVMRGYLGRDAETAEAVDAEGWLHTGDVGVVDGDGFLTITDRKKDIVVTSAGKNVAPRAVEEALERSPFVSRAVVIGDGRPYFVALVALDERAARRWARENGRPDDLASLARDPELRALVQLDVDEANRRLAPHEAVRRFAVLPQPLAAETGELTPTLKPKRRVLVDRFADLVEEMYRY